MTTHIESCELCDSPQLTPADRVDVGRRAGEQRSGQQAATASPTMDQVRPPRVRLGRGMEVAAQVVLAGLAFIGIDRIARLESQIGSLRREVVEERSAPRPPPASQSWRLQDLTDGRPLNRSL